jgi:rare lipoprotein A (peptidoglycan hydrolase)
MLQCAMLLLLVSILSISISECIQLPVLNLPKLDLFGWFLPPKASVRYSGKKYEVKNGFGKHIHTPEDRYHVGHKYSQGTASYYGDKFNGRKTSSCVIFDETQMTGAHPTAVLPSVAQIIRQDTGKSIYVVLTDRGPFAKNRICDLSVGAAKALGYKKQGHVKVSIKILPKQSQILAKYWKKFLHKKLPDELFKRLHSPHELAKFLTRYR